MIYFKDDISIYVGNLNPKPHEHHALEIAIGIGTNLKLKMGNQRTESQAFLILPNIKHQVYINPEKGKKITINLDADLPFVRAIVKHIKKSKREFIILENKGTTEFANRVERLGQVDLTNNGASLTNEIKNFTQSLFSYSINEITVIDDRVRYVTELVIRNIKEQQFSFKDVAAIVSLSESRLAHLFKKEIGIPFRKYVVWVRLKTAVIHILQGESITQASYISGFSDAAHFSNTYFKMFGLKPSAPLWAKD